MTLKDMHMNNFDNYSYNFSIKRKDFKEILVRRILTIDTLDSNIFEKNFSYETQRFRMDKT